MFNKLNEKDKKKLISLITIVCICIISLIVLSVSPSNSKANKKIQNDKEVNKTANIDKEKSNLEDKLTKVLKKIGGAGDVDVLITFEASKEVQPAFNSNQTTETTTEKDAKGGEKTVKTSSQNKTMVTSGTSSPVVLKTNEAKIKGVIVVSSGAKNPEVKQNLYSAVQTSLQIASYQVEVYSK